MVEQATTEDTDIQYNTNNAQLHYRRCQHPVPYTAVMYGHNRRCQHLVPYTAVMYSHNRRCQHLVPYTAVMYVRPTTEDANSQCHTRRSCTATKEDANTQCHARRSRTAHYRRCQLSMPCTAVVDSEHKILDVNNKKT